MITETHDPIVKPVQYNSEPSGIQCWDINCVLPGDLAAAFKYVWRAGLKPGVDATQDLDKALAYIGHYKKHFFDLDLADDEEQETMTKNDVKLYWLAVLDLLRCFSPAAFTYAWSSDAHKTSWESLATLVRHHGRQKADTRIRALTHLWLAGQGDWAYLTTESSANLSAKTVCNSRAVDRYIHATKAEELINELKNENN